MSSVALTTRPIESWPGILLEWSKRRASPFDSSYTDTMGLLDRELYALGARRAVMQLALHEADIRQDGLPRVTTRPAHPGVIVAFESKHGPLQYATDTFISWQDNLRGIALGLEALRRVDRYGISRNANQYTGFRALSAGAGPTGMTVEQATAFLAAHSQGLFTTEDLMVEVPTPADKEWTRIAYRAAAKHLHPDRGGDPVQWLQLVAAYELLAGAS